MRMYWVLLSVVKKRKEVDLTIYRKESFCEITRTCQIGNSLRGTSGNILLSTILLLNQGQEKNTSRRLVVEDRFQAYWLLVKACGVDG